MAYIKTSVLMESLNYSGGGGGIYVTNGNGTVTVTVNPSINSITISGNRSISAYTTVGAVISVSSSTINDTTSSGTVAINAANAIGIPTFTSTSPVTYTQVATLYIAGNPVAGTNVTVGSGYSALYIGGAGTITTPHIYLSGFAAQSSSFDQNTSWIQFVTTNSNNVSVGISLAKINPTTGSSGNDNTDQVGIQISGYYQGIGGCAPVFIGRSYGGSNFLASFTSSTITFNTAVLLSGTNNITVGGNLSVTGTSTLTGNVTAKGTQNLFNGLGTTATTPTTAVGMFVAASTHGYSAAFSDNVSDSLYISHPTGGVMISTDPGGALQFATNGTTPALTLDSSQNAIFAGGIKLTKTIASGTGAQTQNTTTGQVRFAGAATSLVVTNSLCSSTSIITANLATNDTTAVLGAVVAGSGSFTIYMKTAPTGTTLVSYSLTN